MELVIVVAILAVIGAIAVPRMARSTVDARVNGFTSTLRQFRDAVSTFNATTGGWPANAAAGTPPPELSSLIDQQAWARGTQVGGQWDIETNSSGIGCGVGVAFASAPGAEQQAMLVRIDAQIDDGVLTTGQARLLGSNRFVLVLEPGTGVRVVNVTALDSLVTKAETGGTVTGSVNMVRPRN